MKRFTAALGDKLYTIRGEPHDRQRTEIIFVDVNVLN